MRTIKFRGKKICGDGLAYGLLSDMDERDGIAELGNEYGVEYVHLDTVGQFTGLRDKNGKEIYEGDILKVYFNGKSKVFGVVRFAESRFYIDDEFTKDYLKAKAPMSEMFSHYQFEVVGNIHDNPSLLEGGSSD